MHEEPLHLIPKDLREDFEREYGVYIEGELCPSCRMMLETEYNGNVENILVERIILTEDNRTGIGTFTPSDPKSQDIADLTGSIDFSTIAEYGSESDPRAYRFDGELNIANRGMMEFQEMHKPNPHFALILHGCLEPVAARLSIGRNEKNPAVSRHYVLALSIGAKWFV